MAAGEYTVDYLNPPREPAFSEPTSVHWRIFKNQVAMGIGGVAAVLLEFADPRIRSGVWDHSTYKVDPIGRSRRTGIAAMVGVYGPQSAARRVIAGVTKMHGRVSGHTPGGDAYRALDPELLDWVSATAAYGFLNAYDRFVAPVSEADQQRYYKGGAPVARLYGVETLIESTADFNAMMERLAPRFEPHPIVGEFLDIIQSGRAAPNVPRFLHRALARGAVSLLPPLVRDRLELGREYDLNPLDRLALKFAARMADRKRDPESPPWQASIRLGLPGDFPWRSPAEQARLLAASGRTPEPALAV